MTFEDLDAEDFNENNESFFDYLCICIERPNAKLCYFFAICIYCTLYGDDFEVKKKEDSCFFMSADCFDIG